MMAPLDLAALKSPRRVAIIMEFFASRYFGLRAAYSRCSRFSCPVSCRPIISTYWLISRARAHFPRSSAGRGVWEMTMTSPVREFFRVPREPAERFHSFDEPPRFRRLRPSDQTLTLSSAWFPFFTSAADGIADFVFRSRSPIRRAPWYRARQPCGR